MFAELNAGMGVGWCGFETVDAFQDALTSAIEDLRQEWLKLVRLMTLAETEKRRSRIAAIHTVATLVKEAGLPAGGDRA